MTKIQMLKVVIDSNVWINSILGSKENEKKLCKDVIDYAKKEGVILRNPETRRDIKNALQKIIRKNAFCERVVMTF